MMHFPPCFRFPPYFRKIFGLSEKFLQFYLFPTNCLTFIRQNFWWPFFLVIDHKFRISPLFSLFQYISPLFREHVSFPPTFPNFPPLLGKFTCFLILYVYFFPPYFDHDAFMHHPMHVLDAPVCNCVRTMSYMHEYMICICMHVDGSSRACVHLLFRHVFHAGMHFSNTPCGISPAGRCLRHTAYTLPSGLCYPGFELSNMNWGGWRFLHVQMSRPEFLSTWNR